MLASDVLSQQTNGRLNQQLDAELQQRAGVIANDVGARSAADGAAGFDANVLAQLNATDLMMDQYLNKRAGAIDGYLDMSRKTQRDIQSIDARTAVSRQQRATQAAQIQRRYDQRTMDFRMANPMYRGPAPLFDYDSALAADNAMWGAGKQRAQGVRDGIAAGVDVIERSANAYGRAFEKTYDRFNQIMNKGFDSFIDQPADGVRVFTDTYSLQWAHSTFTAGGELIFGFQSDGKVAVGWGAVPAGVKLDTSRGPEFGYSRLYWEPGSGPSDLKTVLDGYGTSYGAVVNLPRIGSFGVVDSVSWQGKPMESPKSALGRGWSWGMSLNPKIDSVFQLPITPVANSSYGQMVFTEPFDLGWIGKGIYWGLK
jgi:hypothetical protein